MRLQATGEGICPLNLCSDTTSIHQITLSRVWLVPGLVDKRLFSVRSALDLGAEVHFARKGSVFIAPNGIVFPLQHKRYLLILFEQNA